MNQTTTSIVRLARIIRWATCAAIAFGTVLWLWLSVAWFERAGVIKIAGVGEARFIPLGDPAYAQYVAHPVFGWAAGSLGLAVTGFGLLRLVQLMRIFESGVVFDPRAARLLGSFAAAIFLRELIDVLAPTLVSIAMHVEDGHTPVGLGLGSGQAHVLFVSLVFLLIARIMAVGHRLADDHAKII